MNSRLFFCGGYWQDPIINALSPEARYLGVYYWTNTRANLIGLYKTTDDFTALETGIAKEKISELKKELEGTNRVHFYDIWIYLPNAQERCGYTVEKNHGKAISRELSEVPEEIIKHFSELGYTIPYPYATKSPRNKKTETRIPNQEPYKQKDDEIDNIEI